MTRQIKFILFGALVLLVVGGGLLLISKDEAPEAPTFSTDRVKQGKIVSSVSATGTLSPVITVLVGSQVSGTIQSMSADFNDTVKKGEVIAEIDPATLQAKLAEAEANVHSSEAEIDKARVEMKEKKSNMDHVGGLFPQETGH